MFNLGWTEVIIILGVAVLIFGPKKIPELGSALGKTLRGFKEEVNKQDDPEEGLEVYDEDSEDVYR
ncbi:twin-arginine translocase TatA/TatE family subunit [Pseudanabaena sp. FACHB-2040]|uniref:Sec-independent protein translocase subunit TatA/TatB n=1 Tax=Pseudanabaena sp. FACHB-2040 TaxID=2692859 RepID=UPI00168631B0|nr:twin-arginine translocase TatA/TatE family subunit [Pseudanabaena sp. FACHB-2040]MBD0267203.1 twin-arginine translocase TatA/TatE family subunit [Cyanobacteria bacterium Co-bin8]MBD2259237.1 twin-arginine translocase TatA/TatE family subunit [Pseudanabaena sp. FACHB-2040]